MVFLTIFFSILFSIYIFIDNIKNKEIVNNDTYYLLNKNTTKKQILYELKSRKIDISLLDWVISSFLHKSIFIPKAGEYLIPKNLTVFEIQKLFQYGKTITRHFTLVEGSTASQLKSNFLKPYKQTIFIDDNPTDLKDIKDNFPQVTTMNRNLFNDWRELI